MTWNRIRCDRPSRGMALPLVLICIAIAMLIGTALINATLINYQHTRVAEQQMQSLWLADSAVQRAIYKLRESPDYSGETWEVTAAELGGQFDGIVTIDVVAQDQGGKKIVVEAVYPNHGQHRVVERRERVMTTTP